MHDNLINTFIYSVRGYIDDAKLTAKERIYECYPESNQDMKKAGELLKIFTNDHITAGTPFKDIQSRAFTILERQKLESMATQITTNIKYDETAFQWEHIDQQARRFKRYLRPIFLQIDFVTPSPNDPLIKAVNFMKTAFNKNKALGQYRSDHLPNGFIPDGVKRYIYEQNTILADRYEFLVYRLLRNRLEAGDVFCRDSILFCSFEDDLINDRQWERKETLIADTGLTIFNQPIHSHLVEIEGKLEERITEVN